MDAILSEAEVNENIEKSLRTIRKIGLHWSRGRLTDREARDAADNSLRKGFVDFLSDRGLRYRFDSRKYSAFLEDLEHFESCGQPLAEVSAPWLTSPGPSGRDHREPAAPADRAAFFRLLKAFHIPSVWFLPPPDDTPCPRSSTRYLPGDRLYVCEQWTDGSVGDRDLAPGERIVLTNRYGQKADILITGKIPPDASPGTDRYSGTGVIEGYTSSREREIFVSVREGQVSCLTTVTDLDDLNAFSVYPLWQEIFAHRRRAQEVWESVLNDLIHTCADEEKGEHG